MLCMTETVSPGPIVFRTEHEWEIGGIDLGEKSYA